MRAKSLPTLTELNHYLIAGFFKKNLADSWGAWLKDCLKKAHRNKEANYKLVFLDATCGNGHDSLFLQEELEAFLAGDFFGDLSGDLPDGLSGNLPSDLLDGLSGNLTGDLTGNLSGDFSGDLSGDFLGRNQNKIRPRLLALDIQKEAIANTQARLSPTQALELSIIQRGHEEIASCLGEDEAIAVAMYNLGYLPGSDKEVVTEAEKSLTSLNLVQERILKGGLLSVHAYGGHEGGREELAKVKLWFSALCIKSWIVRSYETANKNRNPEVLFIAERL